MPFYNYIVQAFLGTRGECGTAFIWHYQASTEQRMGMMFADQFCHRLLEAPNTGNAFAEESKTATWDRG